MIAMLIALAGIDGAGKSTQCKLLKQWLNSRRIEATVLDKWDIFDSDTYPECRFIVPDLDLLRNCIAEMHGPSRAIFLIWTIAATLKKMTNALDHVYISDGYWYKHLASEVLYGVDKQWLLSLVSELPIADIILYFNVDIDNTAVRKETYTPYECGRDAVSTSSFCEHQKKLKSVLDDWALEFGWSVIDANKPPDIVFASLKKYVSALL